MQTDDHAPQSDPPFPSPPFPLQTDVVTDISFGEAQQAEKTIRRLPRGNPVRKLARDVMNRRSVAEVQPLLASLGNTARPAQEREIAAWTLGWTPLDAAQQTQAVSLLRDVLEGEQAPDPLRWQRALKRALSLSVPLTFVFLLWLEHSHPYSFRFRYLLDSGYYFHRAFPLVTHYFLYISLFSLLPITPVSLLLDRKRNNRVRASACVALGRLQSVDAIGALTTALYDRSSGVRRAAAAALKNILPLLTEAHYGLLGVQVIPNLCRALQHGDEILALHVLSALEQVGDGRAVRPVEKMVKSGRTERMRNLALRVLPTLQERQRQEKASKMLLRATTPVAAGSDMLLRAASDPMPEAIVSAATSFNRSAGPKFAPTPVVSDTDRRTHTRDESAPHVFTYKEEQPQQLQLGET